MSERKHTPVPWFVDTEHFETPVIQASGRGNIATTGEAGDGGCVPNARFIVQACNAHEKLVEALEALLFAAKLDIPEEKIRLKAWVELFDQCRAALRKVRTP